ncbi:asialoglycoprotein receptor 2-like [Carcharodon carcharias]|uniref:asialoglycoprotein receptor 2-like n=1 Tax=Carcharodon carcharias TaxID=13397 RepID=UPI001B7DAED4|nr:asialoglycoprotein receptor 2-like [Carcharodon carcharias]
MADDEGWYRRRQREDDSSLEERSLGQPRGRLKWSERNTRPDVDDDQIGEEETRDSLTETQEETSWQLVCGSGWKKLAIGSLAIAALCAIIAGILYSEGERMKQEILLKQTALDSALSSYSEVRDSMQQERTPSDCAHYQDTFRNWLLSFCKMINCTTELCHKNWAPCKGNCYYFSKTILGWAESRQNCISQGSELLLISSQEEQILVNGKLQDFESGGFSDADALNLKG